MIFYGQCFLGLMVALFLYDLIVIRRPTDWWKNLVLSFVGSSMIVLVTEFVINGV